MRVGVCRWERVSTPERETGGPPHGPALPLGLFCVYNARHMARPTLFEPKEEPARYVKGRLTPAARQGYEAKRHHLKALYESLGGRKAYSPSDSDIMEADLRSADEILEAMQAFIARQEAP